MVIVIVRYRSRDIGAPNKKTGKNSDVEERDLNFPVVTGKSYRTKTPLGWSLETGR